MIFFSVNFLSAQTEKHIVEASARQQFQLLMNLDSYEDHHVDSLIFLIKVFNNINVDSSLLIANKAIELSEGNSNKKLYSKSLIGAAYPLILKTENDEALEILTRAKDISYSIEDWGSYIEANNLLGSLESKKGNFEPAIEFLIEAANTSEKTGDRSAQASAYGNIAGIFFDLNDMDKASNYVTKMTTIAEDLDNDELRLDAIALRAIVSMTQGIYYYLAHQADTLNMPRTMDTLNAYFLKSEKEYNQGLDIARKGGHNEMEIVLINNMVALKLNMEKIDEALILAERALIVAEELGSIDLILQSKINLASAYRKTGSYDKAIKLGQDNLNYAKEHGMKRKEYMVYNNLFELYNEIGDHENALYASESMRTYEREIGDIEKASAIAEIETKYQTVQKENQILELEGQNAEMKRKQNYLIGGSLLLGLISLLMYSLFKAKRERNDKKEFAEALIFAQEEERKRIARDLHDGVGQSLLLIKKQMDSNQHTTLENKSMLSETLEEVRSISQNLHPFQLEKFGLTSSLKDTITKVSKSTDIFITSQIDDLANLFTDKEEINIFRTVQEALNNIIKHSEASAAKVSIEKKDSTVDITIQDNGKGFDHELVLVKTKSLGLKTMRERISSLGGSMRIAPGSPKGSIISMTFPKPKSKNK